MGKVVIYRDTFYPSCAELARHLRADYATIRRAVRMYGIDLDAAGYRYHGRVKRRRVTCDGRVWASMQELADHLGITRAAVCAAVQRLGADLDAAGYRSKKA